MARRGIFGRVDDATGFLVIVTGIIVGFEPGRMMSLPDILLILRGFFHMMLGIQADDRVNSEWSNWISYVGMG
jgi:hypothetical protein